MKKHLISLILLLIFVLCSCNDADVSNEEKPIISLPTTHTEQTANGYRNPALAVSSKTSSSATSQKVTSKKQNSTSHSSHSSSKVSNTTSSLPLVYLASKNSKIFHIADCSSAKRIKEENIIIFENIDEAFNKGYTTCSRCLKDN